MSNQADHTIVRLRVPPELKQKIEESAEKNNRSQSAEMVSRIEQSFNDPISFNPNDIDMVTKLMAKSMDRLLEALSEEGVNGDQIMRALRNIANK